MEPAAGDASVVDADREQTYALFRAGRTSASSSALLLIGSLVLFGLVAAPNRSVMDVVMVMGVILLHELGHWVAMRLCGYQDARIFFIPFFGAGTSGRSPDASPWKEGLVLLAGPLPGLLLAIPVLVLGTAQHDELLRRTGFTLLGINAFNLLPLVPLDGGRLFLLVLFGRHPALESGFRVCAAAGLGALAFWLRDFVLGALAMFMVVSVAVLIRLGAVQDGLRGRVRPGVPRATLTLEEMGALYGATLELQRERPGSPLSALE